MSYCCGASRIGLIGTLRQQSILVHHVPLLYCPVCHEVEVHPAIKEEFELVIEYAQEDHVKEATLREEISPDMIAEWKEYCVSFQEDDDVESILREQIDHSLDLLRVSKVLSDTEWGDELKVRLKILTERLKKVEQQKESSKK
ncbi:YgiT-type zinc finger protein [Paenactinomyces guangxiensis]|uniref:YgiT-type zinc finger protein n=1 Tax=Paenactinomyces guangxiensis TaxID=1490290 RepID=A0A7W2A8P3_9BACL|nr:YgiT-type zinc finger protein [Paenactinomyces guangxiensis]MBA4494840.1 YgiT-type zinc finger protein [Paenactinomyces guangxiensis]MBH8591923.1 YgiT-type zinc finger protein [Paenactinomyces guangxiensis]